MKALILFAEAPIAGDADTRLTEVLTREQVAELQTAFLEDAVRNYGHIDAQFRVYVAPTEGELPEISGLDPGAVRRQRGGNPGERLQNAFLDLFAEGFQGVIMIGTDHPSLPRSFVDLAFTVLSNKLSIAVGPCENGGHYLLGMNDFFPEIFVGDYRGDGRVFSETMERAAMSGAFLTVLPGWYDVETPDDLERLVDAIASDPEVEAESTRQVLHRFGMLP
jgi:uncharacterized protein